jgi:anti-sigma regulatory factor (Ser/Thr protein kinase)
VVEAFVGHHEHVALSHSQISSGPASLSGEERSRRLLVATTAASAPVVRRFVRTAAMRLGASTGWIDELVLAVNEAFSNAVCHGTGTAADDTTVVVEASETGLCVQLEYRGAPFDVGDGDLPDDIFQHSGRGRFLMRQLLDNEAYSFHNGVTTLRMFKQL